MEKVRFARGQACNFSGKSAVGEFTLHGDPEVKIEKPTTIIHFPGGSVEISRTSEGDYWAHVAVDSEGEAPVGDTYGEAIDARVDIEGPLYVSKELYEELKSSRFRHFAMRIAQRTKEG